MTTFDLQVVICNLFLNRVMVFFTFLSPACAFNLLHLCLRPRPASLLGFVEAVLTGSADCVWQALAQNCSGLQYLNVGWCEQITDVGVTALALGCRDLRFVDFCGCLQITGLSNTPLIYSKRHSPPFAEQFLH